MTRHSFGEPLSDDDLLVIQGIEYPMNPLGMRAMRRMLDMQKGIINREGAETELTDADIEMAVSMVVESVRPDFRDKVREHIDESVPPNLLMEIATAVMKSFSADVDVDPTQQASSPTGSTSTGSASTAGAPAAELTLST